MMLMPKVIGQVGTIVFWSMEVRALMEVIEYMMSITIDQIDITVENLDYVCRQFLLKVTIIISLYFFLFDCKCIYSVMLIWYD